MSKRSELKTQSEFLLPASVIDKQDAARLVEEMERVDSVMTSDKVRARFRKNVAETPALSEHLTAFLEMNHLAITESKVRTQLVKQLRTMKDTLPVVHMTFATEADPESLQHIVAWLRETVHPQAVVSVGLQPSLVAGVYLRTANHVFDLSIRGKLKAQRGALEKELGAVRG
ncbi:MAG: F0F1 ATP synthase subunit delta [Candidatus Microsaccharimonas sp.]